MNAVQSQTNERGLARRCGCGRVYSVAQWQALPLVRRLEPGDLATLVRSWPENLAIEARACSSCGRVMSRVADVR